MTPSGGHYFYSRSLESGPSPLNFIPNSLVNEIQCRACDIRKNNKTDRKINAPSNEEDDREVRQDDHYAERDRLHE